MNVDRIQGTGGYAGKAAEQAASVADQAAQSADQAIRSTQRVANKALDNLASTAQEMGRDVAPLLNRAADRANELTQRGVDAFRDTSRQVRERAQRASETTVTYIKDEPVKAMLIAAAVGAAVMALLSLRGRSRDGG